jgi:hypothetical protein
MKDSGTIANLTDMVKITIRMAVITKAHFIMVCLTGSADL